MESSLGCSRGQRVFGPAHRLGQWQRVEVSEGGTPANVTAAQRPPFTPFALSQGEIISFTQSHGLQCAITAPRSVSRPSQGEQFGTCNWDRAHVPPEVIRPREKKQKAKSRDAARPFVPLPPCLHPPGTDSSFLPQGRGPTTGSCVVGRGVLLALIRHCKLSWHSRPRSVYLGTHLHS